MLILLSSPVIAETPVRVACVGNSITYGLRIEERELHSYPAVLGRLLGTGYDVRNFGVSGATLQRGGSYPYWDTVAFESATQYNPHIVIIKLGTNDAPPRNWQDTEEFEKNLEDLVSHFAGLPGEPEILICYPAPLFGVVRVWNDRRIKNDIIPAITRVAHARNLSVIDLHTTLQDRRDDFPDGVHPNARGAETIAETVYKAIRTAKE